MLTESIRAIFTTNLGIRKGERVLVFTDRLSEKEILDQQDRCRRERLGDIAHLVAEIGKSFTKNILFHEYLSVRSHGAEPHGELWERAFGAKVVKELSGAGLLVPLLSKVIDDR
ncbi:MAG TPA: hypothetical protein VEI28_06635, partial [Thermodesulfovibrionales bacterium]|nr:hypothetical protein [Thermodesulfovibrionales bacterium]